MNLTGTQFGDLGKLFDGPHATPDRISEGPYFLNIASLNAGRLDLTQSDHVSAEDFARWTRRVAPQAGDLLFSYETRLGEAALMPPGLDACLGRRMALLRPDTNIVDPRYLLYFYLSPRFRELIDRHTIHGATVNRIGLSTMGSWPVSLHALGEQRAIAGVLGALDDKIAANSKLHGSIDEYLATAFAELIPGADCETRLGDLADVNAESVKPVTGGSLRYVDIASVGVGRVEQPDRSDWAEAPSRARRRVRKGDTLWSTVRPNRRSHALNLSDDPELVGSTGLAVLSPRDVGFAYLYEVTKLPQFATYLESAAEGSAYPAVRAERFAEAPVPLMNDADQRKFEGVAAPMRELAHSLDREGRVLAAMRDALLPQLMTGKIRAEDAENAVGEVL